MKFTYITLLLLLSLLSVINGQVSKPQKRATVTTYIPKHSISNKNSLNTDNSYVKARHYDAVSRNIQDVYVNASDIGTDIIQPYQYDSDRRLSKRHLPYALPIEQDNPANPNGGTYRLNAVNYNNNGEQADFYSDVNRSGLDKTSNAAYAESVFEEAFGGRILEQGAVGDEFQPGTNHTTTFNYRTNSTNEVLKLEYDPDDYYLVNGYWPSGSLRVKSVTNAEGKKTESYYDASGKLVTSKTWAEDDNELLKQQVYFIYNNLGQLILKLPVMGELIYNRPVEMIGANRQINSAIQSPIIHNIEESATLSLLPGCTIDGANGDYTAGFDIVSVLSTSEKEKLVTLYEYNNNHQLIGVKHPGAEWEYYIYDRLGRLAMVQNGEQRKESKWAFRKYDRLGRVAYSGTYTTTRNREEIEQQFETCNLFEFQISNSDFNTYSVLVYPKHENLPFPMPPYMTIFDDLNIVYYDTYHIAESSIQNPINFGISFSPDPDGVYSTTHNDKVKGMVTCTRSQLLKGSGYHTTAYYYDDKYRLIQVYSFTDDISQRISVAYNFNGQVTQTLIQSEFNGGESTEVEKWYTYNSAGRLTDVEQQINGGQRINTVSYVYNALGNLASEKLHYITATDNYLQEIDYLKNIQGQLVAINDVNNFVDPKNGTTDLFAMKFGYHDIIEGLTTTEDIRYDGSITGMVWRSRNEPETALKKKAYKYSYDGLNRFMQAEYSDGEQLNENEGMYDVSIKGYDTYGNILGITRSDTSGLIDDLINTYDGNQLQTVSDAAANNIGFSDGKTLETEYIYNANGNMCIDENKGISAVEYNVLNLPQRIEFEEGHVLEYVYTASGTKLRKTATSATGAVLETYYFNGFEYDGNGALVQFLHERGRVRANGNGTFEYDYSITDHLGNVRVLFTEEAGKAKEIQVNDYYPYGMRFNQAANFTATINNYTYSGKELQTDFGLNWTDHHARFYDPALGRWHVQDMAHQYLNPYQAMGNNPISRVDLNGLTDSYANEDWRRYQQGDPNGGVVPGTDDNTTKIEGTYTDENGNTVKVEFVFETGTNAGEALAEMTSALSSADISGYVDAGLGITIMQAGNTVGLVATNNGINSGAITSWEVNGSQISANQKPSFTPKGKDLDNDPNDNKNASSPGGSDAGGYRYGSPESDIVTTAGSAAGGYWGMSRKIDNMVMEGAPKMIAKHYSTLTKTAKFVGKISWAGDAVSIAGAGYNLGTDFTSVEYWADFTFAVIGVVPVVGDGIALSYMGGKDYVMNPQNYSNIPQPGSPGYMSPVQNISDSTFKVNIQPIDSSLNNILKLNGYRYNWIESPLTPNDSIDIGVLAQEVEVLYPELVTTDSNGVKRVYYYKLIPVLIEAVKEQQVIIVNQDALLERYYYKVQENEQNLIKLMQRLDEFEKPRTNK